MKILHTAFLLSFLFPLQANAQEELRADRQILVEGAHGVEVIKEANQKIYVLSRSVKPPSGLWVSENEGASFREVVGGESNPSELRVPKDFAIDRDGNTIIADGSVKVFSPSGVLLKSFPSARPSSVGVLSDSEILVSGLDGNLISVFDPSGKQARTIGTPVHFEDRPIANLVENSGKIIVDRDDNIYYVCLYKPIVRRFSSDGTMTAEWHIDDAVPAQVTAAARAKAEQNKQVQQYSAVRVLTAAAFDEDSKTLWVDSGQRLSQLDQSGKIIRSFELVQPDGGPIQASGLVVDRNLIRVAGPLNGAFEFAKPH